MSTMVLSTSAALDDHDTTSVSFRYSTMIGLGHGLCINGGSSCSTTSPRLCAARDQQNNEGGESIAGSACVWPQGHARAEQMGRAARQARTHKTAAHSHHVAAAEEEPRCALPLGPCFEQQLCRAGVASVAALRLKPSQLFQALPPTLLPSSFCNIGRRALGRHDSRVWVSGFGQFRLVTPSARKRHFWRRTLIFNSSWQCSDKLKVRVAGDEMVRAECMA